MAPERYYRVRLSIARVLSLILDTYRRHRATLAPRIGEVLQPVVEAEGRQESVWELLLPPETPLWFGAFVWDSFSALATGCSEKEFEKEYLLDRGWKKSVPN